MGAALNGALRGIIALNVVVADHDINIFDGMFVFHVYHYEYCILLSHVSHAFFF